MVTTYQPCASEECYVVNKVEPALAPAKVEEVEQW